MLAKQFILLLFSVPLAVSAADILPNPQLSPGVALDLPVEIICTNKGFTSGYWKQGKVGDWVSKKEHQHGDVPVRLTPESSHRVVFSRYGLLSIYNDTRHRSDFEDDHIISLELGGSNSISNRFPQSYLLPRWNAHTKDRLENALHKEVCDCLKSKGHQEATVLLKQVQSEIAGNWTNAYLRHIGKP